MRDVSTNCRFAPEFGSMRRFPVLGVNLFRGGIIVPVIIPGINVADEAADRIVLSWPLLVFGPNAKRERLALRASMI